MGYNYFYCYLQTVYASNQIALVRWLRHVIAVYLMYDFCQKFRFSAHQFMWQLYRNSINNTKLESLSFVAKAK